MRTDTIAPRYLSLANDLRMLIEHEALKPGDRLLSEANLSGQYGFSRGTVVKAIEVLVADALINRHQGSGSFVAERSLHRRAGKLLSFTDTVREDGHKTHQKLLELQPADQVSARKFGVAPPAMSLCRLCFVDGQPCAIHRSIIPQSVFERLFDNAEQAGSAISQSDFSLICSMSDCLITGEQLEPRKRQESLNAMAELALETVIAGA